jgi:RNA polymerase sigma-70 factor (ECF subfamily)
MDFSTPLDDITLAALKRDCRRTQESVYRRFSPAAWTLAVRLTGCEALAWDAVQAGFVRAFERAGQVRQGQRFGAWLRRIIVNQVMDQHRRRLTALDESDDEPIIEARDHDGCIDLARALDRLDPVDRMVLWLHDAEGMTHTEIAELGGQSLSWSKSRLSRARARIRPFLEDGTDSRDDRPPTWSHPHVR